MAKRATKKKRYTPKGEVGTGQRFKQLTATLKKRKGKAKSPKAHADFSPKTSLAKRYMVIPASKM